MIRRSTTSVTPGADDAASIASCKYSESNALAWRAPPNRPSRLQLRTRVRTAEPRGGWLHYSVKLPRLGRLPEELGEVTEVGDEFRVALEPIGPGLLSKYKSPELFSFAGPASLVRTAGNLVA